MLRLDYCSFVPFCSTGAKLLLSIYGTHMFHISIKRHIIRLSNDMNNIRMDKRILLKMKLKKKNLNFIGQRYLT